MQNPPVTCAVHQCCICPVLLEEQWCPGQVEAQLGQVQGQGQSTTTLVYAQQLTIDTRQETHNSNNNMTQQEIQQETMH